VKYRRRPCRSRRLGFIARCQRVVTLADAYAGHPERFGRYPGHLSRRTLRLTAAGELLVAHAEIILVELAAAESGLAALRSGRRGIVRITAFVSAARTLIAPLWQRLADTGADTGPTPELSLRLSVREPDEALDELHKRATDLALVHSHTVLPRSFPAAYEQALLVEEPVLLALLPRPGRRDGAAARPAGGPLPRGGPALAHPRAGDLPPLAAP
jgi:DNA-binding transcriptional LysR family regulator